MLDDGESARPHLHILAQYMQRLSPEPLRRVDAALVSGIIGSETVAPFIDFGSFTNGRVIFPENEHRIGVLLEPGRQGQRHARRIGKRRRRTGRIESNADNLFGRSGRSLCQSLLDGCFEHFDVIRRMLAVTVGRRVAI